MANTSQPVSSDGQRKVLEQVRPIDELAQDPVAFLKHLLAEKGITEPRVAYLPALGGAPVPLNYSEVVDAANRLVSPMIGAMALHVPRTAILSVPSSTPPYDFMAKEVFQEAAMQLTKAQDELWPLCTWRKDYEPSHQPLRGRFVHMHKNKRRRNHPIWKP
ncbi:hypothetical protein [Stenotrophomonas sp. GD03657]|uniref:hypothetical protein n=1 Tax=Stenotrophomonas sp. GD03657 TaxID=2975363 RepID=UPI002448EBD9|nr:hypothetical protein [Stenotrophomonas sp. GD03657]MDH2154149.1 hypothetical protein [Stenotrophomonas sp. GD03657]